MKELFYSIFTWLSGTDRETLDTCSKSEHIKHAGYGTLVMIPAILGTIAMSFAISTLTNDKRIFLSLGFVWGCIVLLIDRFLIATLKREDTVWNDILTVKFFTRIIFAVGVGIVVSHPLVLFFFNDTIEQELDNQRRNNINMRLKEGENQKDSLYIIVNVRVKKKDCLERLLTAEQSGIVVNLECGYSSGLKDCKKRCEKIQGQINDEKKEIEKLQKKIDYKESRIDTFTSIEVNAIEKVHSKDYISRVNALSEIEKRHKEVGWVRWFLMLFFIFVDILPITLKVFTKIGEYDVKLKKDETLKVQSINLQSQKERAEEEEVINRLHKLKREKIDDAFQKHSSSTIDNLLNELRKILPIEYLFPSFTQQNKSDKTTQSQEAKETIVEQKVNTRKGSAVSGWIWYLIDTVFFRMAFSLVILFLVAAIIYWACDGNKDWMTILIPTFIGAIATLYVQIVPQPKP